MTSRAGLVSPARVASPAAATAELTGSVLGGRHSGHAMASLSGEAGSARGLHRRNSTDLRGRVEAQVS